MKPKAKEKKLMPYLLRYWKIAIVSPIFMLGEVLVDLLQPTLMSRIVDEGVLGGNMTVIVQTGLLMLALVIVGGIMGVAAAGFASSASQNFGNDLRCDAFDRVMHLSLQQTDSFTTGSLVTRLTNDITAVQDLASMALRMFVRAPISFIGGIIMAVRLNINFGIVLLCSLPFELVFIILILRKASPLFSVVQKKLDRVNAAVQEAYAGAEYYGCDIPVVVCPTDFTIPARELAESTGVELWDGERLSHMMRVSGRRPHHDPSRDDEL